MKRAIKSGLTLVFLMVLAFSARLALAVDNSGEQLLAKYRDLIVRSETGPQNSGAALVQRAVIRKLERELRALGHSDADLDEQKRLARNQEDTKLDGILEELEEESIEAEKVAEAKMVEKIKKMDFRHRISREKSVDAILAEGEPYGLKALLEKIRTTADSQTETLELEIKILNFLAGQKAVRHSEIRRAILIRINDPGKKNDSMGFAMESQASEAYGLLLNPDVDDDIGATIAVIEELSNNFNNMTPIKTLLDALGHHPEYISYTTVKTLFDKNHLYADFGYMFELLALMPYLTDEQRKPMLIEGLHYVNRNHVEKNYFAHPIFHEPRFLKLLSQGILTDYTTAYTYGLKRIFSLPEFAGRKDLADLAPHIIVDPCEKVLSGAN